MANIRKRGSNYLITAYCGYDVTGKQLKKTMTYTPPKDMTEKQIEKEVKKQAVIFEEQVKTGQILNSEIRFKDFADKWFSDYAEIQLKKRTIARYKELMKRINQAIGHIKLSKLQPIHLLEFYKNLQEEGIHEDTRYTLKKDILPLIKKKYPTKKQFCEVASIGTSTLSACLNNKCISYQTADKISSVLNKKN